MIVTGWLIGHVRRRLGLPTMVGQLVQLGILAPLPTGAAGRRFHAPAAYDVLVNW